MRMLSSRILSRAKKLKAIDYLGGKCELCGNDKWYHMEFHHINNKNKEYIISVLKDYRWSKIVEELEKCVLYCRNCHHEYHFLERNSQDDRQISKRIYLEYKGNKCEECGYNKCQSSLTFHHLDPDKKEIQFSEISERINSFEELKETIIKELDKCQLLCHNCHQEKHTDFDFFNKYYKEIIFKKENMIERKKIDGEKVMKMYNSGMRQVDIRREMDLSKSTVSCIIKRNKLKLI